MSHLISYAGSLIFTLFYWHVTILTHSKVLLTLILIPEPKELLIIRFCIHLIRTHIFSRLNIEIFFQLESIFDNSEQHELNKKEYLYKQTPSHYETSFDTSIIMNLFFIIS